MAKPITRSHYTRKELNFQAKFQEQKAANAARVDINPPGKPAGFMIETLRKPCGLSTWSFALSHAGKNIGMVSLMALT
ncbi:MAG: hypothetical protein A2173_06110 [Planctomycetes bacterium RBG_13_44_8b]|nr:MAG: hypothetical protein A2173_06110 [Planctomycetes bacterium RBG_13_44_8b]